MKNRYLNFSNKRFKAGFLAILLISATTVAPAKAGWFSNVFSSFFSANTDNKGPMIAFAAVVAAGVSFALYRYLFKIKKTTEKNSDEENTEETSEQKDQTDADQSSNDQSDNNNNDKTNPTTSTFTCSDEEYLRNSITSFSNVAGKKLQITDDVSVVQFYVFNQNTTRTNSDGKEVHVTSNDSCGYHAADCASHMCYQYKKNKLPKFPTIKTISVKYGSLENSLCQGGGYDRKEVMQKRNLFSQSDLNNNISKIKNSVQPFIDTACCNNNDKQKDTNLDDIAVNMIMEAYNSGKLKINSNTIQNAIDKLKITTITLKKNNSINNTKKSIILFDQSTNISKKYNQYNRIFIKNYDNKQGDSLDQNELNNIINTKFNQGECSILGDVDLFNTPIDFLDVETRETKENILNLNTLIANNKSFRHAFIMSTSNVTEQGGQTKGTYGHYFALVLHYNAANNKRTYMITDSKNIVRLYNDPEVKKIISVIEEQQIAQKLILPHKEQEQFKNEIDNLLVNKYSGEGHLDLMSLATRYKQWGGKSLPTTTIEQISTKYSID